ncbi:WASH complex subunit 1-like [Helianthus annuus]|uniref:WASH complex subunit 1-like n=1 Tax=Helianthus annuus TaxID=4232 RepID=UPI000B8F7447|nr:WASH complex subunit 1-like [Helianthus annuus]
MEFDDLEPAMAPEPVAAPDPVFEHDPIHAGVPIVDPVIADLPVDDHPVDAPLLEGDYVVAAAQADAPLIVDVPAEPVIVAPLPDPVPLEPDHALFATHIDPRYAHTQNGWIDADDELPPFPPHTTDARHLDFPFSFAQFTLPARPGEGSSAHPFGHVPTSVPVIPQFSSAIPPVPPFSVPPFTQREALTRRIQELERAQPPPCQCRGQTHPATSQPPRPLSPDSAARLLALEQQMASWIKAGSVAAAAAADVEVEEVAVVGTHKLGIQLPRELHRAIRGGEHCSPMLPGTGQRQHSCSWCGPVAQRDYTPLNRRMQELGYQNPTVAR